MVYFFHNMPRNHLVCFILKIIERNLLFSLIDCLIALFLAYRKFGYEHGVVLIIIQMENIWLDNLLLMDIKLQVMGSVMYFID